MAAEDARYRESTQYRLWSFSPAQLAGTRERTNELARASISERLLSAPPTNPPSVNSISAPASGTNTPDPQSQAQQLGTNALPEFLTPAEELQMLNVYTAELLRAGEFMQLVAPMRATAAIFLRRFYVTNSIMTYPPNEMLKTCLFLGAKAEGYWIHATKCAEKFPKTTAEGILAGEFLLCQGLRFSFDVKHPFRALEGAVMELRQYGGIDDKRIANAANRAREILKFSPLMTDAYFHYTPSQIMLAALSLADHELCERMMHETFHQAHSRHPAPAPVQNRRAAAAAEEKSRLLGAEMRDKVQAVVESCRAMLAKELPERMVEYYGGEANTITRPLVRKLKKCRDPDRRDLVALQKARREQASLKDEGDDEDDGVRLTANKGSLEDDAAVFGNADQRDAKRRKVTNGLEDPFGGPL